MVCRDEEGTPLDLSYRRYDRSGRPRSRRRWRRPRWCPNRPIPRYPGATPANQVKCRNLDCSHCVHVHIVQAASAIAMARPTQFLTLTMLPGAEIDPLLALRRVQRLLREKHFEMCGVVERHRDGRPHMHVLLHGPRLSARDAQAIASRAGLGRVDLRHYFVARARCHDYLMKQARLESTRKSHLADNGGRLIATSTKGFWRDAVTGEMFGGLTAAKAEARRRYVASRRGKAPAGQPEAHPKPLSTTAYRPTPCLTSENSRGRGERAVWTTGGTHEHGTERVTSADDARSGGAPGGVAEVHQGGGPRPQAHRPAAWPHGSHPTRRPGGVPRQAHRRAQPDDRCDGEWGALRWPGEPVLSAAVMRRRWSARGTRDVTPTSRDCPTRTAPAGTHDRSTQVAALAARALRSGARVRAASRDWARPSSSFSLRETRASTRFWPPSSGTMPGRHRATGGVPGAIPRPTRGLGPRRSAMTALRTSTPP